MLFCDRPPEYRFLVRGAVEGAGGDVCNYCEDGIQVAFPSPTAPLWEAMRRIGMEAVEGSLHYFPIGTDAPEAHLRHDGRYPGSKGFWLLGRFRPAKGGAA